MFLLRLSAVFLVYSVFTFTGIERFLILLTQNVLNTALLIVVSWFIGNYTYRRYFSKWLLGKIKPENTKVVLITGCDTGFGFRTAIRMSIRGFTVIAGCLSETSDGAQKLKRMPNTFVFKLDVTKQEDIKHLKEEVERILRESNNNNNEHSNLQLYALINNAGIAMSRIIEWVPPNDSSDFEKVLDVNLMGIVRMTRAFLPFLRQSRGRIVNISSAAAREVSPSMASYAVSKAAASKFSESLELEIGDFGVKVITLEPFFYRTEMVNAELFKEEVKKGYEGADKEVKFFYGPESLAQALAATEITNNPLVTNGNPEQLVDIIEEALLSPDPEKLYQPGYKLPLRFVSNFLPWNVSMPLRRWTVSMGRKIQTSK